MHKPQEKNCQINVLVAFPISVIFSQLILSAVFEGMLKPQEKIVRKMFLQHLLTLSFNLIRSF